MGSYNNFISVINNSIFNLGLVNLNKAMFNAPTLGLPVSTVLQSSVVSKLTDWGLLKGVPIMSSKMTEIGENSVGKQIVLRTNAEGTDIITDNIAPQPRVWEITGYVSAHSITLNQYFPSTAMALANTLAQSPMLVLIKDYIRYLRNSRAPFYFTTDEGEVVEALLQNYTFTSSPEAENATQVTIRVMEYVVLEVDADSYIKRNAPKIGQSSGKPSTWVSTGAKVLTNSSKLLTAGW